jgi:hypothetical protein
MSDDTRAEEADRHVLDALQRMGTPSLDWSGVKSSSLNRTASHR